jgi:hypothetical protein
MMKSIARAVSLFFTSAFAAAAAPRFVHDEAGRSYSVIPVINYTAASGTKGHAARTVGRSVQLFRGHEDKDGGFPKGELRQSEAQLNFPDKKGHIPRGRPQGREIIIQQVIGSRSKYTPAGVHRNVPMENF